MAAEPFQGGMGADLACGSGFIVRLGDGSGGFGLLADLGPSGGVCPAVQRLVTSASSSRQG